MYEIIPNKYAKNMEKVKEFDDDSNMFYIELYH